MEGLLNALANVGRPVTVGPRAPIVIGPRPPILVEAPPRFAWDEKGWIAHQREGYVEYRGLYRTCARRTNQDLEFLGSITHGPHGIAAYIADPPTAMRSHPHGICLQLSRGPWFSMHWTRPPSTVDDALLFMERMLDESFNDRRR